MSMLYPLPRHYGVLLALCLGGLLALWWFMLGSRYRARRRRLRRHIDALPLPPDAAQPAGSAGPRAAVTRAREQLLRSPAVRALRHPLYDLPWLLFIGEDQAGLPALLAAARRETAAPSGEDLDEGRDVWRWHLLTGMVAIEAGAAALREPATPCERALWYRALLALADERERLPLNGIVVCVNAASLLGDKRRVVADAARLRLRVDEAAGLLRVHLPVYVLVTGLEQLAGYEVLRAALPPLACAQVLGHRLPDNAAAAVDSDALFEALALRLHALRMGLLRRQAGPVRRQAIHAFVEQMRALGPGLHAFAQQLFQPVRSGPALARWRGLYFVAAPGHGDQAAFIADLFKRFLPADQPLAG